MLRRVIDLDQLADELSEDRGRHSIEPMSAGAAPDAGLGNSMQYLLDPGPCRTAPDRRLTAAKPIYREELTRALSFAPRASRPRCVVESRNGPSLAQRDPGLSDPL